jgi:hypothetical protein
MEHIIPVLRDREDIPEDLKAPDLIIRIGPEDPAVVMADQEITTDPEDIPDRAIVTDPEGFRDQEIMITGRADIPDQAIATDPEDFRDPAIMTDPADFQGKEATIAGRVDIKGRADRADFPDRADRVGIKDQADRADFPGRVVVADFQDLARTVAADSVVPDRADLRNPMTMIIMDPEVPAVLKDP